jgi:excisionase family DNA binding protein
VDRLSFGHRDQRLAFTGETMVTANIHEDLVLLSVSDLAKVLGTSTRTVWRLLGQEKLPAPARLGTRLRWRARDIDDWITAGMPDAENWVPSRS